MDPLPPDPVIDEIRAIRREISAQFDHDPKRLVEYFMEFQEQFRDRFVASPSNLPQLNLDAPADENPSVR